MNDDCEAPIKARELIAALEAEEVEGEIADPGDAGPYLQSVTIEVDDDHRCSLAGRL